MQAYVKAAVLSALIATSLASPQVVKPRQDTCLEHYTTVTGGSGNGTSLQPTGTAQTPVTASPTSTTSTSSVTPSCAALISLPPAFYIQDGGNFVAANFSAPVSVNDSMEITEVATQSDATVFYVYDNVVNPGFTGLNQLAFNHTDPISGNTTTYLAWARTTSGSAIQFFSVDTSQSDLFHNQYFAILAAVDYMTCILGLGGYLNKYVDTPLDCDGVVWLATTQTEISSGCPAANLTVSAATS